jgi:hypothetical protein
MFTIMTQVMDIIEDFFRMRGYLYLRLDGSVCAAANYPGVWRSQMFTCSP